MRVGAADPETPIEPAPQADLDDRYFDPPSPKQMKGEARRGLEERQGVTPDFRIEFPSQNAELILTDWIPTDLKPLPKGTEVG